MALRDLGIRARILLSTLLPATILAILLGGYLAHTQLKDLQDFQQTLGRSLAQQLAPASEYGLFTKNSATLQELAESYMINEQVTGVVIRDEKKQVLARTGIEKPDENINQYSYTESVYAGGNNRSRLDALLTERGSENSTYFTADKLLGTVTINLSPDTISEKRNNIFFNSAIIVSFALLTILVLGVIVSRSVTNPLQDAIRSVARFGRGQLNVRVKNISGGELGELATGINDMASIVQNAQERLQEEINQATKELQETLESVEIKNVELDLARKRALAASQVKSEFLANMSHEIRTPMNAIVGFTRLLQKTPLDADQQEYLTTISESAETLLRLLEDVLNLSRIEAGRLTLDTEEFSPVACAESVLNLIAEQAYRKRLDLIFHHGNDLPSSVRGDAGKLRQILMNLLHNAVKFTDTGNITLAITSGEIEEKRIWLNFTVQDTGPGISKEQKDLLFQPFAQLENTATKLHGGAGLGLAICQRLSTALGGKLELENIEPIGSSFTLRLPFDRETSSPVKKNSELTDRYVAVYDRRSLSRDYLVANLQASGADCWETDQLESLLIRTATGRSGDRKNFDAIIISLDTTQTRFGDNLHGLWQDASHPPVLALVNSVDKTVQRRIARALKCKVLPQHASFFNIQQALQELLNPAAEVEDDPAGYSRKTLEGQKILIVEDNRINARLITEMLIRLDALPQIVETGRAAIVSLDANPPDAILLDMHLPDMDGLEVARALRASRVGNQLRIYALTASSDPALAQAALEAGVDEVLVKPVDEATLVKTLGNSKKIRTPDTPNKNASPDMARAAPTDSQTPLDMLREDLPVLRNNCLTAIEKQDLRMLKDIIHQLNGAAGFCKLDALQAAAAAMERAIDAQNWDMVLASWQEVAMHITNVNKG